MAAALTESNFMDENSRGLPFTVRGMLDYGTGAVFELEVNVWTYLTTPLLITGTTRENPFTYRVVPAGNYDQEQFLFKVSDIPIFLSVNDNDQYNQDGTIWVEVFLRINSTRVLKLCSGFVTTQRALTWPVAQGPNPSQEVPLPFWWALSNPAAGANWAATPGTSQRWILQSIAFRLVTSATAADRRVHLKLEGNDGVILGEWWGNTDQTASLTKDYVFSGLGVIQSETHNNVIAVAIPAPMYVTGNMQIKTAITNIQVGDQISRVRLHVAEMACKP